MTAVTVVQLVAPQQLASADNSFYKAPAQTTAKIGRAVFTNTTGSAVTITAGISTGGPLSAATTMISGFSVAAGSAYVSPELAGAVLPAGSALRAFASIGAAVTFTVSGLTFV